MPDQSANLSLPLLQPAQAQKHVTHNEALQVLDALVQLVVIDRTQTTPPVSPAEGDRHIVPAGPGGWAGPAGSVAVFAQGAWIHHLPRNGWQAHVLAENRSLIWQGGDWIAPDLRAATLGVNAAADATNRLTVAAPATLFTHAGAGHQLKLNKAAAGDTASLLFQTGFAGRAEIGLAGSDAFSVKVSADGAVWNQALTTDPATGRVQMPAGLEVSGTVTGTAVAQTAIDTTAGRLLRTGDGGILGVPPVWVTSFDGAPLGTVLSSDQITEQEAINRNLPTVPGSLTTTLRFYVVQTHGLSNRTVQRAVEIFGIGDNRKGKTYHRVKHDATWSAWRLAYDAGTALMPVAQSGGTPTGGLIERGTNANGTYTRLADGTQICTSGTLTGDVTTAVGAGFRSAALTWTFPAAFATTSGLIVVGDGVNSSATHWASARALSVTQAEVSLHGWQSTTARTALGLAIGRWF